MNEGNMIFSERSLNKVIDISRNNKKYPYDVTYNASDFNVEELSNINLNVYYSNPINSNHMMILDIIADSLIRRLCRQENIIPQSPYKIPRSWFINETDIFEKLTDYNISLIMSINGIKMNYPFLRNFKNLFDIISELSKIKICLPYYNVRTISNEFKKSFPNQKFSINTKETLFDLDVIDQKIFKSKIFDATFHIKPSSNALSRAFFINCVSMNLDLIPSSDFYNLLNLTQAIYRCFILPNMSDLVRFKVIDVARRCDINIQTNPAFVALIIKHLDILKKEGYIKNFKYYRHNFGNSYIEVEKNKGNNITNEII